MNPSNSSSWVAALLMATLSNATPLILAAMGGVLSERAGVVNIALEGLILAGAFAGAAFGQQSSTTGMIAVLIVGAALGFLHAFLTQKAKMNHVVSGLGITLLVIGATRYLNLKFFATGLNIPGIDKQVFLILACIMPFAVLFLLNRTTFGLRLRAVGENPESARMTGISSALPRYAAVTLSGILAALAGAYLSMGDARTFSTGMSSGKGYVALAAVIFGRWNPLGATLGALFFGFFFSLQSQMQIFGWKLNFLGVEWTSPILLDTLPYVMTLIALLSTVGRATPPAALGKEED